MSHRHRIVAVLALALPAVSFVSHVPSSRTTRTTISKQPSPIDHRRNSSPHENDVQAKDNSNRDISYGLYVHIPYCRRRCKYCDFAIVPIGKDQTHNIGFQQMDLTYRQSVVDEISLIGSTTPNKIPLRSIYFGGGTPSLAPLTTLREIMRALLEPDDAPFYLENEGDAEITIEMDPGTFNLTYLEAIKAMGFNRISLGVQSFDDDILATMGRVHRSADVYRSIEMIQKVFGEEDSNYSIDLISGVPGLTLAGWTETLYNAVRLHPRPLHISLYDLQVEQGTYFGKIYGDGRKDDSSTAAPVVVASSKSGNATTHPFLPSSEDCAFMYRYASGYLRSKRYQHYEISSYAYADDDGLAHRSKHNQIYWEVGGQWYAIGLGSTSNVDGVRFARPRALSDYISWTRELKEAYGKDVNAEPPWLQSSNGNGEENVGGDDDISDIIMTRLRTSEGLDLDWIAEHYDTSHVEAILGGFELALDLDLGERVGNSTERVGLIRLKDPNGFLFSNNIISNIFVELDSVEE